MKSFLKNEINIKNSFFSLWKRRKVGCRKGFVHRVCVFMPQWYLVAAGFIPLFPSPSTRVALQQLSLQMFQKAPFSFQEVFVLCIYRIKTCEQGQSMVFLVPSIKGTIFFTSYVTSQELRDSRLFSHISTFAFLNPIIFKIKLIGVTLINKIMFQVCNSIIHYLYIALFTTQSQISFHHGIFDCWEPPCLVSEAVTPHG